MMIDIKLKIKINVKVKKDKVKKRDSQNGLQENKKYINK